MSRYTDDIEELRDDLADALDDLADMVADRCSTGDGTLDAMFSNTSRSAISTLARHGRVRITHDESGVLKGVWVDGGAE